MTPQPGTYWRDDRSGVLVRVKVVSGDTVDYEGRVISGWVRADAWHRYFTPTKQDRKAA